MRTWQWLAVPFGIGLFVFIVANPYTYYADLNDVQMDDNGNLVGGFNGWKYGFLSIGEIKRLNEHETKLSSGPFGNAQPYWLVVILLVGLVAGVCSFIFGFRLKGDPLRKQAMVESIFVFIALGLAIVSASIMVIYGFSWRLFARTVVLALVGIVLLWASSGSRSHRVSSSPSKQS